VTLRGALRDAAVLRRVAMRTTSRNEQVARKCLSGFAASPRWCALTLVAYGQPSRTRVAWGDSNQLSWLNGCGFSLGPNGRSVRSMLHVI
jgi:hypothetical protein